jgi:hypothetical protein
MTWNALPVCALKKQRFLPKMSLVINVLKKQKVVPMVNPVSSNSSIINPVSNGHKEQPNAIYRTNRGTNLSLRIDTSGLTREEVGDRMADIGRRMFDEQEGVIAHTFNQN